MKNNLKSIKKTYTRNDFDLMTWHDCRIYAINLNIQKKELSLDIDYIFEWVAPSKKDIYFKFWIAPCNLIFSNVENIKLKLEAHIEITIDKIIKKKQNAPEKGWLWIIETFQGKIEFKANNFKQFVKTSPVLSDKQFILRKN